ncbi:MAG: hypothetical protein KDA31_12430 [Phycisphaerales bacterium]|nr:hypothetical protein [Phycisphaerales bacterium]MCB9837279.1 hypothetical protein [Phycisphaera sp.]
MLAPIQRLLRKAAGVGASRRGTVLLLVLGSLALVLILAVVYAAIGKGDRRTARTTNERKSAVDNINAIADYIGDVLAIDVFNVVPEVTDSTALADIFNTTTPIMRRENVDMPVTDYFFTSVPSELTGVGNNQNLANLMRFHPDGGHSADILWDDFASDVSAFNIFDVDPRTASDPFLASTRPVDLGGNGPTIDIDTPPYLRAVDWAQISNFAPDGRFVNLFYLRDNFGAPSLDLTRDPNSRNARLTLLDRDGNPTEFLPFSDMLASGSVIVPRREADWNKPMHWTMYQRRLFRPINDPAFNTSSMGDPSSEDYWAYQYADADGDGILDSRWFELVDYTNPTRPVPLLGESDMRYFVAARAIDLSSLVNVATATDFLAPSTTGYRVGSGPEDISLFKLLNFSEHTLVNSLPNEIDAVDGGIDYDEAFATGEGNASDFGIFSLEVAQALGRKSNLRLSDGRNQGSVRPFGEVPTLDNRGNYNLEPNPNTVLSDDIRDYTLYPNPAMRVDYTASVGSVYPGASAGGNSRTAPYSIDDLVELLTFHGINDDRNFSKLEQALSAANSAIIPQTSYSQLRSASPTTKDAWVPVGQNQYDLKLMRSAVDIRRMLTTVSGSRPLRSSILDLADYSKLSENVDRKLLLDTLVLDDGNYPNNDDGDTIADVREEQSRLISNAFGVYLSVLAPDLRQDDWAGNTATAMDDRFRQTMTQYYGHMGPELAVRLAGHLALNFRDMADAPFIDGVLSGTATPDGVPDVGSVLDLDLSNSTDLDAYNRRVDEPSVAVMRLARDWDPTAATGIMRDLWDAGLKLDIDDLYGGQPGDFIADDGLNVSHTAMILYGVEPQPFLSQVSSMVVYTDADPDEMHDGINPAGEWAVSQISSSAGPDGIAGNIDDFDGLPNINGDVLAANNDFVFQAVFFQLFNPFDVPIVLDHYYIEFADSFFPFSDGTTGPVILEPRSTLVVWASNPGNPADIDMRLRNVGVRFPPFSSGSGSAFEQMISQQIGANVDVLQLPKRFAGNSGGIVSSGSYGAVMPGNVVDLFYDVPSASSDVNRVAMLWRDAADYNIPSGATSLTGLIDWTTGSLDLQNRKTDQLVDRLRDSSDFKAARAAIAGAPTRAALDRRLDLPERLGPNGEISVVDALRGNATKRAGPGFMPAVGGTDYNFGGQLGVAMWGSISRRDDTSYNSGSSAVSYYTGNSPTPGTASGSQGKQDVVGTPVGALPAKVFEPTAHSNTGSYNPYGGSTFLKHDQNVAGNDDDVFPEALDLMADFEQVQYENITTIDFANFWQELQSGIKNPEFFVSLGDPVFGRDGMTSLSLSTPITPNLNAGIGNYEGDNYIKVTVNQTEFRDLLTGRRTLRVGDMLLPLAVGAYRTPLEPSASGAATPDGIYATAPIERIQQYEAQWTTLGEALAAASGYSDSVGPGGGVASSGPKDPFRALSYDLSSGFPQAKTEKYVLDRGQLRLDAFVPFIDMVTTTGITEGSGDFTENEDIRRGLGVPMALNLFDIAQAGIDNGIAALGGIDRPVMGTINANTAEPEVLRLHPALAMDMYAASNTIPADNLWWPRTLEQLTLNTEPHYLNMFRDKTNRPISFADVGSTVAAYRDPARYTRLSIGSPLGGGTPTEVDSFVRVERVMNRPEFGLGIDRAKSEIDAIRPLPGFESIGELFAARDMTSDDVQHQMGGFSRDTRTLGVGFIDRTGNAGTNNNYGHGVDFYKNIDVAKINQLRNGQIEIATFGNQLTGDQLGLALNYGATATPASLDAFPGNPSGPLLPIMPDQIPDSYDEQLVQLNAVLNSMTVRSDYYAVWFVVQGFKESDTQDLSDTDPLVPSFKARYLMIVDRSNVTEKGDRPHVLAFVQLPMLPDPSTATN